MAFVVNTMSNLKRNLYSLLGKDEDSSPAAEETAAPFNIHPIDFNITLKPGRQPELPPDVQAVVNEVLDSMSDAVPKLTPPDAPISTITRFETPNNGHGIAEITQDATGRTIQILQESFTELPTEVSTAFNVSTKSSQFTHKNKDMLNIYIIVALVLILILIVSGGIIVWCRKNKLKTERRNTYPVIEAVNSEYMDPQMLKKQPEKLKTLP